MRRGTQGHVAESHADPRSAPTWCFYIYYIYYLYIYKGFFVLHYMGRVIPLETVGSYKPDGFLNIFRVGLTHTLLTYFRWRGARRIVGSTARVDLARRLRERRTIDRDQTHVPNKGIITAGSSATWQHRTRRSRGGQDHRRSSNTRAFNKAL